jgi:hypothetical protein
VDVGERSIMPCPLLIVTQVTHRYLTSLTLQPLDHSICLRLIHGTVEQRILVLLLLLTNLPLDCVAPTGGYVGDLQVQDIGCLTILSIDGEYTSDTLSEPRGSVLPASVAFLMGRVFQEPYRGWSRLVFDLFRALASTVAAL